MPLQMPQVGQGMNPLIARALMSQQQGVGGPQLPQPAMRPSGSGLNGGGFTATGPAPQQPAKPGVGGMMANPMQMMQMGQMLKGMMAQPLPIGAASGAPLGSLSSQGMSFAPGMTGMNMGMLPESIGGMNVGGGLYGAGGAGFGGLGGAGGYGGMGAMDFGGGLAAPAWNAGSWGAGLGGGSALGGAGAFGGGDAAAFGGGAWLGGDAALGAGMGAGALGAGGGAALAGGGAAEGIGATIAANPELWALAFA